MTDETETETAAHGKGREGAQWINQKPTPEEFAQWFKQNVSIDEGLEHEDYVGGVVLIPALDTKAKHVTGFADNGAPIIAERSELRYIPYAKVETRVNYFWDLMELYSERWVGVIEPVKAPRTTHGSEGMQALRESLPEGFSLIAVPYEHNSKPAHSLYVVATYRVSIFEKDAQSRPGGQQRPVRTGIGTKQVPLARKYPDDNALMKAETGAIGRALGVAGIFVIPGSGVATAEDMIEEARSGAVAPQGGSEPELPAAGPAEPVGGAEPAAEVETAAEAEETTREDLVGRAKEVVVELRKDYPLAFQAWQEWLTQRDIKNVDALDDVKLKGVVKKLEKLLVSAKESSDGDTSDEERAEPDAVPDSAVAPEPEEEPDGDAG